MQFTSIKPYLHFDQSKLVSVEIPKGTIFKKVSRKIGEDDFYVITNFDHMIKDSARFHPSLIESNPEYFKSKSELAKISLINFIEELKDEFTPMECVYLIVNHFGLKLSTDKLFERLSDYIDSIPKDSTGTSPLRDTQRGSGTAPFRKYWYNSSKPICHCGNDGTKPCLSVICDRGIEITY
jgi:hypothetical protein